MFLNWRSKLVTFMSSLPSVRCMFSMFITGSLMTRLMGLELGLKCTLNVTKSLISTG